MGIVLHRSRPAHLLSAEGICNAVVPVRSSQFSLYINGIFVSEAGFRYKMHFCDKKYEEKFAESEIVITFAPAIRKNEVLTDSGDGKTRRCLVICFPKVFKTAKFFSNLFGGFKKRFYLCTTFRFERMEEVLKKNSKKFSENLVVSKKSLTFAPLSASKIKLERFEKLVL